MYKHISQCDFCNKEKPYSFDYSLGNAKGFRVIWVKILYMVGKYVAKKEYKINYDICDECVEGLKEYCIKRKEGQL